MTITETTAVTERKTAAQALVAVMRDVDFVAKTHQTNAEGRYMFRGIDDVINAIAPALRKYGAFVIPRMIDKSAEVQPTAKGGSVNLVRVTVDFAIYGEIGDPIIGTAPGEAFDSGDKATAKAMSVAFRTFLLQALAIPTNEPDPDQTGFERGSEEGSAKPIYWDIGQRLIEEFKDRGARLEFVETTLGRKLEGGIESLNAWDVADLMNTFVAYKKARIEGRPMRDAKDFIERMKAATTGGTP
jgi:hypothetical protein